MTPIQQAKATYEPEDTNTFEEDLVWHLHNAYVYSDRETFVMGRPMPQSKLNGEIKNDTVYPVEDCNTWFVWLAAGKDPLKRFLEVAPIKMEYVGWHRRGNKLRLYKWKDYERKVNRYGNKN